MKTTIICTCFAILAVISPAQANGILNLEEFQTSKTNPSLMPGERHFERPYDLGRGRSMPIIVDVTAKGNGVMRALNAEFPVYDMHDDGNLFRNGLLTVELADLDGDGFKDLIVFGVVDFTEEKSGRVTSGQSLVAVFHYDPDGGGVMRLRFFSGPEMLRECFRDNLQRPKVNLQGQPTPGKDQRAK